MSNIEEDRVYAHKFAIMQKQINEKVERIKELEEENHLQRKQIMSAYDKGWILKQKVKDKMEKLNKETKNADTIEAIFKIKQQQILEELLEDK